MATECSCPASWFCSCSKESLLSSDTEIFAGKSLSLISYSCFALLEEAIKTAKEEYQKKSSFEKFVLKAFNKENSTIGNMAKKIKERK